MVIEILYNEVCNLYGDGQNVQYLQQTLPDAQFVFTELNAQPYFVDNAPDMIYIGSMSESIQRRVIDKLLPYKERILQLIEGGTPILATGNASEVFAKSITYVTESITTEGLGVFDLTVKTDLFNRYNGKVLGNFMDMTIVGFRSQFSFIYGDNRDNYFVKCVRGDGINKDSKLEGFRKNNLICTQILGPILPLNPLFCEYFVSLAGANVSAAHRDAAIDAHTQRIKEFSDSTVVFGKPRISATVSSKVLPNTFVPSTAFIISSDCSPAFSAGLSGMASSTTMRPASSSATYTPIPYTLPLTCSIRLVKVASSI